MRWCAGIMAVGLCLAGWAGAQEASNGGVGKLPHIQIDVKRQQVRVECESLDVEAPLEFLCVVNGTNEHEALLRSAVKPSHLHTALLMLGLQPGSPVRYVAANQSWLPPHGPPLHIFLEYQKDGRPVRLPAYRWMRSVKTKKPMPMLTWIFAGSRVMEDGAYAADATGYLVSIVNFELTVIDIPDLASSDNEKLEWERDPEVIPKGGTPVTMVIETVGPEAKASATAATAPVESARPTDQDLNAARVTTDQARMEALRRRWEQAVAPQSEALRQAAQAHYEVIGAMRREQQRLVDEAERIQRVIDQLERQYQNMTTPRPEPAGK